MNYLENIKKATARGKKIVDFSSSLSFDRSVTTTIVPLLSGNTIAIYPGSLKEIDEYVSHT